MKTERTVNALAEMNGRVHVYLPNQAIGTRFIQQAEKGGAAVCVSSDFYKKKTERAIFHLFRRGRGRANRAIFTKR